MFGSVSFQKVYLWIEADPDWRQKGSFGPGLILVHLYICSTYMHRDGESKHVPPFSHGLYLSTQRNPVENKEIN